MISCPVCGVVVWPEMAQIIHIDCLPKMTTDQYYDYLETKNDSLRRGFEDCKQGRVSRINMDEL